MKDLSDSQLLRVFAERRSEAAFAEIVRRHVDLVYSASFRMVHDAHLAKDVSQGVFVALAQGAGKLVNHPVLPGWLHRTTRNIAAQRIRTEVRRRRREREAAILNESPADDPSWEEVSPHLDAALGDLADADRDAVLLRYFENKSAGEMAAVLGISAEAAQKRVSRAVEKLRKGLARRGVTAGSAGLATAMSANAVQAAPAGFAASVGTGALVATISTTVFAKILGMVTVHKTAVAVAAVLVVIIGGLIYQVQRGAGSGDVRSGAASSGVGTPRGNKDRSLVETLARARAEKPPVDRKLELARLKGLWMRTKSSNDNANLNRQIELSKESADILMCSEEMLELIAFVEEKKFYNTIDSCVEALFSGPRAAEARQLLIELPDPVRVTRERSYSGGDPYRDEWSLVAGRHCPEEEFDAFREALRCPQCQTQALYGRNLRLMETDPEAAFTSSLETFLSGAPSVAGRYGVTHLFGRDIKIPENTDFADFESRLPLAGEKPAEPHDPSWTDPVAEIRKRLLWKWGEIDPAAAANHVMAYPERMEPKLIEPIVGSYSSKNPSGVVAWVATFPEGPYFDAAAAAAAIYARPYPEARELVLRIGDEKIREKALKDVAVPAANPGTR